MVTGASGGLGAGVVESLRRAGMDVVGVDLRPDDSTTVSLDVTDSGAVEEFFDNVESRAPIDVLVNCHGVLQDLTDVADTPDAELSRVMTVNFVGAFHTCRAAASRMRERRWGRIVNVASQAGRAPWPGTAVYGASKGAVIALTQGLAAELGPAGVTVNAVCPGVMLTSMTEGAFLSAGGTREEAARLLQAKAESLPVRRLGTAEDVGSMVAYLVSPGASFVTGTTQNLTGGEQYF